jgi:release factor glutamine methyltransferase
MSYHTSGTKLSRWYEGAKKQAIPLNIPLQEIDWLLQELTTLDRLSLRLNSYVNQSQIEMKTTLEELERLWQLRIQKRLPVQYLVGRVHWRDFTLKVSPDVLIPRPETEYIVDLAVEAVQKSHNPNLSCGHWADLGTGSGAIALGLAKVFPQATIHAVDVSSKALAIAQENAVNLGLAKTIKFYQGSWWLPLEGLKGKISGMVSNPPYIPSALVPSLQPEVAHHEPRLALDGGHDGLNDIRYLVKTAPLYLLSGGLWLIEMMAGQAVEVSKMLQEEGNYHQIKIFRDLAGIERFALAYRG